MGTLTRSEAARRPAGGARRTLRAVVAEPAPGLRRLLVTRLRADGFDVIDVGDGVEALEALGAPGDPDAPDLLVLGGALPGLPALDVLEEVRAVDARLPAILLVDDVAPPPRGRAIRLGAVVLPRSSDLEPVATWARLLTRSRRRQLAPTSASSTAAAGEGAGASTGVSSNVQRASPADTHVVSAAENGAPKIVAK